MSNDVIRDPGKFEGEPSFVPELWDMVMDGGMDDEFYDGDKPVAVFMIDNELRTKFPAAFGPDGSYSVAYAILLYEDSQGFVNSSSVDSAEELTSLIDECAETDDDESWD